MGTVGMVVPVPVGDSGDGRYGGRTGGGPGVPLGTFNTANSIFKSE